MLNDLGALTLLGESADWLKGANGKSIRDYRLAAIEAYRNVWKEPENEALHEALRMATVPLFESLRANHLYADELQLRSNEEGPSRYLTDPKKLREDFEALRGTMVVNKFGIGEVHVLYHIYLLCRMLHAGDIPYDKPIEQKLGDIIFLTEPVYRADNVGEFSDEVRARFHAVRILRCMKSFGLLSDQSAGTPTSADHSEMRELLTSPLRALAAEVIQRRHHLPFVILDTATALEAFARAHAAGRAPEDDRPPDELYSRLRRHARRLDRAEDIGPDRVQRLTNLATAAIVRALSHVDPALGLRMYTFLRSSKHKERTRHSRMFELLPNDAERLRFLNFLYANGKQNPMYYVERFQPLFGNKTLKFVDKSSGFTLEQPKPSE